MRVYRLEHEVHGRKGKTAVGKAVYLYLPSAGHLQVGFLQGSFICNWPLTVPENKAGWLQYVRSKLGAPVLTEGASRGAGAPPKGTQVNPEEIVHGSVAQLGYCIQHIDFRLKRNQDDYFPSFRDFPDELKSYLYSAFSQILSVNAKYALLPEVLNWTRAIGVTSLTPKCIEKANSLFIEEANRVSSSPEEKKPLPKPTPAKAAMPAPARPREPAVPYAEAPEPEEDLQEVRKFRR